MRLNDFGKIVRATWDRLPNHYQVELDAFVVMPNHVHGIVVIPRTVVGTGAPPDAGGPPRRPRRPPTYPPRRPPRPPTSPPHRPSGGRNIMVYRKSSGGSKRSLHGASTNTAAHRAHRSGNTIITNTLSGMRLPYGESGATSSITRRVGPSIVIAAPTDLPDRYQRPDSASNRASTAPSAPVSSSLRALTRHPRVASSAAK